MIFDCWTPRAERGRGHYAEALRQAAANLLSEGRAAWIFSGATNKASLRGILKAGFQYRFSFVRRTRVGRADVCVAGTARPGEAVHQERHTSAA
jgi:hypothetical protein